MLRTGVNINIWVQNIIMTQNYSFHRFRYCKIFFSDTHLNYNFRYDIFRCWNEKSEDNSRQPRVLDLQKRNQPNNLDVQSLLQQKGRQMQSENYHFRKSCFNLRQSHSYSILEAKVHQYAVSDCDHQQISMKMFS